EPYGLSAGAVSEAWEAHLTGYARDPLHAGGPGELGGAALAEVRAGIAAVGLSGRAAFTAVDRRLQAGPYAKVWLEGPKLLLMAEVDGVHQRFQVPGAPSRGQLAAYAGPVWIPLRGLSWAPRTRRSSKTCPWPAPRTTRWTSGRPGCPSRTWR